jgi:N-acetylmuramoyl-L-alanine amidase
MDHLQSGQIHAVDGSLGRVAWGVLVLLGLSMATLTAPSSLAAVRFEVGSTAESTQGRADSAWREALLARRKFESEPGRMHTRQAYEHVMNQFRVIYRDNPGDKHSAAAVEQVAELFAERGRELNDRQSIAAAVGQYEYLAKAYPGDRLAPVALEKALDLVESGSAPGRDNGQVTDPEAAQEAGKIRAELAEDYPQALRHAKASQADSKARERVAGDRPAPSGFNQASPASISAGSASVRTVAAAVQPETGTGGQAPPIEPRLGAAPSRGALSMVTGIRHWSTASYTRVAIDLNVAPGQVVKYEAARVEDPDRIFFDLEDARLGAGLAGKNFPVTDDGFLERVRVAQFKNNVTRVVLDVHHVTEYSAFWLPNPYRLIIDIHGEPGSRQAMQTGDPAGVVEVNPPAAEQPKGSPAPDELDASASERPDGARPVEISSLPAMPVTDGRTSFGMPRRVSNGAGNSASEASPRAVPEPLRRNSTLVTDTSTSTGNAAANEADVAEVSRQPGMVEATRRPSSKPIAETNRKLAPKAQPAPRLSREARPAAGEGAITAEEHGSPAPIPPPTSDGETSLMRTLGLKIDRIVIDAGHGGHDSGTLGAGGIEEKNVVLDVALRLGKLLHDRLGADVVYTRDDDTFVPLETRTAIANKAQADLFISVHANSSHDPNVHGVEVYYLNFTTDPEAMKVAARENAVSTESVHDLSDLVKKIALQDKIDESRELATDVDQSLYAGQRHANPGLKNRGVKKAPFVVLIGANMPSILAEIGFVTNPRTAAELETPQYRERVAESLYRGIARYAEGVNGVRPRVVTEEQAAR